MVSTEGGVEIEKVASETPEKIFKVWIEPGADLEPFQARQLAFALEMEGTQIRSAVKTFMNLWNVFRDKDCSLMEINPLIVTVENDVIAVDAKINFDGNALYRHPDIAKLQDLTEEQQSEVEAKKFNLNYIKLDGTVGCMVNGAGLAMGTMDIIKLYGGEPANFLDVGGVANAETVAHGFEIILSDPNVNAILINIFGGIVRCDRVAQGVIDAMGKIMSLGLSLTDIVKMTTLGPAKALGMENEIGSLQIGRTADISIFELIEGQFIFHDVTGATNNGNVAIRPKLAIKNGDVMPLDFGPRPWGWLPNQE